MKNCYTESFYYFCNFHWNIAKWGHGTKKFSKNIQDKKRLKKIMKKYFYETKNRTRVNVKSNLSKISVNSEENYIENIMTKISKYENFRLKWYWFC